MTWQRRAFLEATTYGTATILAGNSLPAAPSDKVAAGIIGTGGQGRNHVASSKSLLNVEVAYVCDVDDPAVDVVSIATPDHWHTPAALLALAAGKHVSVEKPCSHNVREGRWLVDATSRTGKVVQHGTQSRSAPFIQAGIQRLRSGIIGDQEFPDTMTATFGYPSIDGQVGKQRRLIFEMRLGSRYHPYNIDNDNEANQLLGRTYRDQHWAAPKIG